jgi:hypothetical protein
MCSVYSRILSQLTPNVEQLYPRITRGFADILACPNRSGQAAACLEYTLNCALRADRTALARTTSIRMSVFIISFFSGGCAPEPRADRAALARVCMPVYILSFFSGGCAPRTPRLYALRAGSPSPPDPHYQSWRTFGSSPLEPNIPAGIHTGCLLKTPDHTDNGLMRRWPAVDVQGLPIGSCIAVESSH